jgi:hypothetical protein
MPGRGLHWPKFYNFTRPDPRSIWPEPEVYLQILPNPTEARIPFIPARMKSGLFTMCPDYRIINTCLF